MFRSICGRRRSLSVLWVAMSPAALWSLVVFGVLLVLSGLWSLAMPGSVASEYVHIGLGVLLFISPWALSYAHLNGLRGRRG